MVVNTSHKRVVNASYVLAYILPDEVSAIVDKTFAKYKEHTLHFIAPSLLRIEVLGGIWSAVRKKRITHETAFLLAEQFSVLDIEYTEVIDREVLLVALKNDLTVFDASYFWLSKSKKLPLLTLDKELLRSVA